MSMGLRIKTQRIKNKLTQPQLAERLGLGIDMIKQMEINNKKPSIETLGKMCDLFNCSADYLLGKEDSINSKLIEEFSKLDLENQQRVINIITKLNDERV